MATWNLPKKTIPMPQVAAQSKTVPMPSITPQTKPMQMPKFSSPSAAPTATRVPTPPMSSIKTAAVSTPKPMVPQAQKTSVPIPKMPSSAGGAGVGMGGFRQIPQFTTQSNSVPVPTIPANFGAGAGKAMQAMPRLMTPSAPITTASGMKIPGMALYPKKDLSAASNYNNPAGATTSAATSNPALGKGGADYTKIGWSEKKAMEQDIARLNTDPAYKQSEIDRALKVKAERTAAGLYTSGQDKYLASLGYRAPVNVAETPIETATVPTEGRNTNPISDSANGFEAPAPTNTVPVFQPTLPVRDTETIRKYVDGQYDQQLSNLRLYADQQIRGGETTANQQLQALQTGFDRQRQTLGEDRAVQDVQAARNLSPFSGRSDYTLGMMAQERGNYSVNPLK